MGEGSLMSLIAAPRTPEFRRLSHQDRMELDAHYSMVKSCVPAVPLTFYLGVRLKKVEDIKFPFVRETIMRPLCKGFNCRPRTIFFSLGTVFILAHIGFLRLMAMDPHKNEQIRFIEQDRGLVHTLSMPFIPKERRWSSVNKEEWAHKDFVTESQAKRDSGAATFDPHVAFKGDLEGTAEKESAWEKVRRETK